MDSTELPMGPMGRMPFPRVTLGSGTTTAERNSYTQVSGGGANFLANGTAIPRRILLTGNMYGNSNNLRANAFTVVLQDAANFNGRVTRVNFSSLTVPAIAGTTTRYQPGTTSRVRIDLLAQFPINQPPGPGADGYAWYQQPTARRTLTVNLHEVNAVPQQYQFTDCGLVTWEPSYDYSAGHRELLVLDCRLAAVTSAYKPQLAGWLTEAATNTTTMRSVRIDYTGTVSRSFTYGSAFPVRYVFPQLDASSTANLQESIELQSDTLLVQ